MLFLLIDLCFKAWVIYPEQVFFIFFSLLNFMLLRIRQGSPYKQSFILDIVSKCYYKNAYRTIVVFCAFFVYIFLVFTPIFYINWLSLTKESFLVGYYVNHFAILTIFLLFVTYVHVIFLAHFYLYPHIIPAHAYLLKYSFYIKLVDNIQCLKKTILGLLVALILLFTLAKLYILTSMYNLIVFSQPINLRILVLLFVLSLIPGLLNLSGYPILFFNIPRLHLHYILYFKLSFFLLFILALLQNNFISPLFWEDVLFDGFSIKITTYFTNEQKIQYMYSYLESLFQNNALPENQKDYLINILNTIEFNSLFSKEVSLERIRTLTEDFITLSMYLDNINQITISTYIEYVANTSIDPKSNSDLYLIITVVGLLFCGITQWEDFSTMGNFTALPEEFAIKNTKNLFSLFIQHIIKNNEISALIKELFSI